MKRLTSYEDPDTSLDSPLGHRRRRPRRNGALCTCRPWGSSTSLFIYGLQLFCSQEISHSPNCPHKDGLTSWSCGVRALNPKIQMTVGIQLGGWTLSMVGRLSPHNLVDPEKSPAFIAVKEASRDLQAFQARGFSSSQPGYRIREEIKSIFHILLQKLRESFESGTAYPSDHTPGNLTLLHVCHQKPCF